MNKKYVIIGVIIIIVMTSIAAVILTDGFEEKETFRIYGQNGVTVITLNNMLTSYVSLLNNSVDTSLVNNSANYTSITSFTSNLAQNYHDYIIFGDDRYEFIIMSPDDAEKLPLDNAPQYTDFSTSRDLLKITAHVIENSTIIDTNGQMFNYYVVDHVNYEANVTSSKEVSSTSMNGW
ncbi:MAG: hypothetical protein ACI389_06425 [Methanobrevibacter sp.]|uniref:hypothetical protein n=1 Tax=Methanobrevibacter sp. TaxID=66852 RepID=UPI003F0B839D